jgi:hypothetical protein
MTAQEVIKTVAKMPYEDWVIIQRGIADMMVAEMSTEEIEEIRAALAEADAEIERGDVLTVEQARTQLGLP